MRILICALVLSWSAPTLLVSQESKINSTAAAKTTTNNDPSLLELRYQERSVRNPKDSEALEGLATLRLKRGDYSGAIDSYRQLLVLTPENQEARLSLGRALAFHGQYSQAVEQYRGVLAQNPHDNDAQEAMAQAHLWSGHPEWALPIYEKLVEAHPQTADYLMGQARAQIRLRQYRRAHLTLETVLTAHPQQHEAEVQLAYLDIYEHHPALARWRFNQLLRRDPTDREALEGNARLAYYRGDLGYAHKLTSHLVEEDPRDTSSMLLLARVDRALHHLSEAHELVGRTEALDPGNAEARDLENSLDQETGYTFHTSASFARETTTGNPSEAEDLTTYGFENTWGGSFLPRSQTFVSLYYLPSESPSGGTQGAVAPSQVLYRQTSYLTPRLTGRFGVGMVRFGPDDLVGIPTQSQNIVSAGIRPIGFVNVAYAFNPKLDFTLGVGRSAITYTPVSTRLGVVEDRIALGFDFHPSKQTVFQMQSYLNRDSTAPYSHAANADDPSGPGPRYIDNIAGLGTTFKLDHRTIQRRALNVDFGYDALLLAYNGHLRPYLGFFEPGFYQRHYLTSRFEVTLRGPVEFEFYSGVGVQQIERATPVTPAFLLSPKIRLKVSPRVLVSLGYSHYNNAQSLGTLRGDAFQLTTDWRF